MLSKLEIIVNKEKIRKCKNCGSLLVFNSPEAPCFSCDIEPCLISSPKDFSNKHQNLQEQLDEFDDTFESDEYEMFFE